MAITTLAFSTMPVFVFLFIITGCLLSHLTIAKPTTNGFSLKLIHMHSPASPFYHGHNLTTHQKIQQLAEVSMSRYFQLQSRRISKTVGGGGTVDDLHAPNMINPPIFKFTWLYHVQVYVGTPPMPNNLLLDTGSELPWIQCKPCEICFHQRVPTFDPSDSTSYTTVSSNHPFCRDMARRGGKCKYEIGYLTGPVTRGTLSRETFTFLSTEEDEQKTVIFGCSNNNQNFHEFDGDGILGMNLKQTSFIRQLTQSGALGNMKRFSYCLVPPDVLEYTHLKFGDNVRVRGVHFESTPFVPTGPHFPNMYGLNLIDISVNEERLDYPDGSFALRDDGTGGCIIDSGASVSLMDSTPYDRLKGVLMDHFAGHDELDIQTIPGYDLCYNLPNGFDDFPGITFHFEDNANLDVDPLNNFILNHEYGYFCFGMKPVEDGTTFIGAIQQQHQTMVYDLNARRLKFLSDPGCAYS